MGVRVVTDSSCDLLPAQTAELGVEVVPLTIRFGEEELVDGVDLTLDDFWRRVATAELLPETAAPSAGAFEAVFERIAEEGADGIVSINLSSRLSATMQSAQVAAKALDGRLPVAVVDSKSVSMGLGMQVLAAARLAREGADLGAIISMLDGLADRVRLYGTLDTLDNLRKGGRVGAAQALVGGMLSIKPVIQVRDGVVAEAGKVRTRSRSLRYLAERIATGARPDHVYVCHAQAPDVDELVGLVSDIVSPEHVTVGPIGPVIGTHAGPRTIGVGWVEPG